MGNVIEINGRKYDAATGKLLGSDAAAKHQKAATSHAVSVDGMVGRKKPAPSRVSTPKVASKSVQRSQTLMRTAVKKPQPKTSAKPTSISGITKSHLGVSRQRLQSATSTQRSPLVTHFGGPEQSRNNTVVKKIQHMPVKKPEPAQHHTAHSSAVHTAKSSESHAVLKTDSAHTPVVHKQRNAAAAKMIEAALANATAHEQPLHQKTRRRHKIAHRLGVSARAIAISSTVLAGVLLGGFFAIQNVPNLSMRVAAARAGFDATMPGYSPSGFGFKGPINYSPGQVVISFKSATDNREYELTQRASNWNSDALLANFVAVNGQQYQAYKDRGRTLFIYGKSNATWVDNGIWYQIEGESQMTTDQIIRVAASM